MADDFVVTGTRPPSVAGLRPMTTASNKDCGYYTKHSYSSIDETLFHSHHNSPLNAPVTFAASWGTKKADLGGKNTQKKLKPKPKPTRPLFWAPESTNTRFSISNEKTSATENANVSIDSSFSIGTIRGIPLKHQYRHLTHTPTFVDETLFGKPLMEPTFKAPWEEKKKTRMFNWYQNQEDDRKPVRKRRPATALGVRGYSAASASAVPIWKP